MFSFLKNRNKNLLCALSGAFPRECQADVKHVIDKTVMPISVAYNGQLYSNLFREVRLLSGESIRIPERIYINDRIFHECLLTPKQRIIYHCIFSRSYDGYIREKHVKALLNEEVPEWAMPFVIKLSEEYVREILEVIYDRLSNTDCGKYKELCALNFEITESAHSRMISYWNEYYRYSRYGNRYSCEYKDYVGNKLFRECFDYFKSGQKFIRM